MIPCRIHGYAVFGYFYGVRTAFVAEELIGKVTGIRYTPLLKPSDSDTVTRQCADVPKKRNLIVTGCYLGTFSFRCLKTLPFLKHAFRIIMQKTTCHRAATPLN